TRSMAKVEHPVDLRKGDAKTARHVRLANAGLPHQTINFNLGARQRRQRHEIGSVRSGVRNLLARRHAAHERALDRVDRPRKRVIAVFAEGQGIGKTGDGDEDRSIVVAHERDAVAQGHELHSLMSSCLRIASHKPLPSSFDPPCWGRTERRPFNSTIRWPPLPGENFAPLLARYRRAWA